LLTLVAHTLLLKVISIFHIYIPLPNLNYDDVVMSR